MAYKALYRTYRPSTFDEVAGQQHIVKTLKNAIATGKIAHAYLFAGPRGTGKTTMAKLMAKALNCDEGFGHQCNCCKNCEAINEGTHPDVLELDAASNNGVEDIREIIDKVKYSTILGRYKIYIIDEVHMLSAGAFNALLKTLEEPPEHVIFILATTEPHKILPTILSRCQRYDFSKVSEEDIKNRLKTVLQKEGVTYNDEAVDLIISLADGGMRDALSILDQVLAYSKDTLNVKDILDIFALESTEEKIKLITSIVYGDMSDVLDRLSKYLKRGTDIKRLTDDLLVILKDVLIFHTSKSFDYLEMLDQDEVIALSKITKHNDVMNMISILLETVKDFKNVASIKPLFEVTLLKLTSMHTGKILSEQPEEYVENHIVKHEEIQKPAQNEPVEEKPIEEKHVDPIEEFIKEEKEEKITIPIQQSLLSEDIKIDPNILKIKNSIVENHFKLDDDIITNIMVVSKKQIKMNLIDNWSSLKPFTMHPNLGKAASLLLDGRPLVACEKVIILEFQVNKLVEKVNDVSLQMDLQNIVKNVFGNKMFVYAVSRSESVRLQQRYMNLMQIKRLPKPADVVLEFEGE